MFQKHKIAMSIAMVLTASTSYAEEQVVDEGNVEVIQITGIRSSIEKAALRKRDSDSFVDAIVAEDLGKFPDQNVAESLQRITGITIERSGGEGSKITVRSFGPEFNGVRVNNRTIATVSRGREFDFRMLASEIISGADVVKTPTASMVEGSIGASINIRTAKPFDFEGFQAAASLEAQNNEMASKTSPRISGVVSNTWDEFGALFSVAYDEGKNRTDKATGKWGLVSYEGERYRTPTRLQYAFEEEERKRLGVNTVLEWKPNENVKSTFDLIYSKYERISENTGISVPLQFNGFSDAVISEDGNSIVSAKKVGTAPVDLLNLDDNADTETYALGFNTQYRKNNLTLTADISYSKAEVDESVSIYNPSVSLDEVNGIEVNNTLFYDMRTSQVGSLKSQFDYGDPANVHFHFLDVRPIHREDEVTEVRFDGNWIVDNGIFASIDTGVFYTDREQDHTYSDLGDFKGITSNGFKLGGRRTDAPDDVFYRSNNGDFLSDIPSEFVPREWARVTSPEALIQASRDISGDQTFGIPQINRTESRLNTEEVVGLYVQGNFSGEIEGMFWSGNVGLRYAKTDSSSAGHSRISQGFTAVDSEGLSTGMNYNLTDPVPVAKDYSYSNLLPSVNFSLEMQEGLFFRAAAAKVMTRPSMNLTGVDESYSGNFESASHTYGNPTLDPFEATQYDLGVEYYLEDGDSYSINLFHKNIGTFISSVTSVVNTGVEITYDDLDPSTGDPITGLDSFGELRLTEKTSANRGGGSVTGIEVSLNHSFTYLPGILSGFGIQANYTYADSKDKDANKGIELIAAVKADSGLEGFTKNSYNITAYYDKDGLQARIAYNWHGDYLRQRFAEEELPDHVAAYGQYDFSASYAVNDMWTLTSSVINLTDEHDYHYADVKERMNLVSYSGRRFNVGVRAKF